jgi:Tfp pilus assembly protein PilO
MNFSTKYVSIVALLLAVPLSAWVIAYEPMNNAVHSVAQEIKERTSKLLNYDEVNAQYRDMKTIVEAVHQAQEKTISRIPTSHGADQWLESASNAALQLGLVVQSVTTAGERVEGDYRVMPVDFNVHGSFASVYKLVQHFEQMDRLTKINQMTIHREDEENVNARFVVHLVFGGGSK